MLDKEQIENNYNKYIELLKSVKRDGIEDLIKWLDTSDLKTAPASTKYHCAYEGGLVQHSLNVHKKLVDLLHLEYEDNAPYSDDTIILVSLLHDVSKVNYYEIQLRNVKENGTWVQREVYQVKDSSTRFIYGSHAQNSVYMLNTFIKLSYQESLAILHHMGGIDYTDNTITAKGVAEAFEKSPLALLLHQADQQATFLLEVHDE